MSSPALDHTYRYPFASSATPAGLTLATSGGVADDALLFTGRLRSPRSTADLLLTVSEVSRARCYTPPGMLARIVLAADPVVTCGDDRLRWEAFSACCGVYARLDLVPDAWDGDVRGRGTTNVDFNSEMRRALSSMEVGALSIGADRVELHTDRETVVERRVPLPVRWLKGFAEVGACQARAGVSLSVGGDEARRFLRSLSAQDVRGRAWLVPAGRGVRLSQREVPGAVEVGGVGRLKLLQGVARYVRSLDIHGGEAGVSAWVLHVDEGRLHVVLSPEASRGFSGEGQVLTELAAGAWTAALSRVHAQLRWRATVDLAHLGGDTAAVRGALAALAARGLVGYDLAEGGWFHRELPFELDRVETLQPRLRAARKLVEEGGVRVDGDVLIVIGSGVEHTVRPTGDAWRCTCPWFARHQGERGPCKHVLAAQIARGGSAADAPTTED